MKIITIASLKGGVGKTSDAIFLAQAIQHMDKTVLVVDADPNNNATDYFLRNCPEEIENANLYHLLKGMASLDSCIYESEFGIDIIPCTPDLNKIGFELGMNPGAIIRFEKILRDSGYDIIIIDTPPSMVFELRAALFVADLILSPVGAHRWMSDLDLLKKEINFVTNGSGRIPEFKCIPSIVTAQDDLMLRQTTMAGVLTSGIIKSDAIKNSSGNATKLSPGTKAWKEFLKLAEEVCL